MSKAIKTERRELYVNGMKFKISHHAAKRCGEMGIAGDQLVQAIEQGTLYQHTPMSKHYKDGKGWLIEHEKIAVGLAKDGPGKFTVITLLWRKHEDWHQWFDEVPDTTRERRPYGATEAAKESA